MSYSVTAWKNSAFDNVTIQSTTFYRAPSAEYKQLDALGMINDGLFL